MKRKQPSEGHAPTAGGRGRDLSEQGEKATEQGALTSWRREKEGLVTTWKESDRIKGTHSLERAEGDTCQDRGK